MVIMIKMTNSLWFTDGHEKWLCWDYCAPELQSRK